MKKKIGILVGSPRKGSYSRIVASHMANLLGERFEPFFIDITALTIYNPDLDNGTDMPESWRKLRHEVKEADAVLFCSPEYNRSTPAILKNALDIASRPFNNSGWSNKPGAVITISPGKVGGFGGNHHLRQIASCLNILMMAQPEAYLGNINEAIGDEGIKSEATIAFLQKFADAFAAWIDRLSD